MGNIKILKDNGVDIDNSIELLGDIETYDDILNEFVDNIEDRKNKLKEFYESNDLANYAIEVHALKSDSKYLGFVSLADMALEHQLKSEGNDMEYIKSHYSSLIEEINKVMEIVNSYKEG